MDTASHACPPAIVEAIRHADMQVAAAGELFSELTDGTSLECRLYALVAVADRLDSDSHPAVIGEFCKAAATYARVLNPDQVEKIRDAYLRVPYVGSITFGYFTGLRLNHIDIRDHVKECIRENWAFIHPRDEDAETWHHYLYLGSLGEPGAMEKLAEKIAQTENGNDATNLLHSFAALQGADATKILQSYANDQRRADGVEGSGSGMTIAETIEQVMAYRK